jgi:stage II sporulation protein D
LLREHRTITLGLETYVRGVVAAEMPASFQLEALKAQAIASRTYIVRRFGQHPSATATATVTDGVQNQAFLTDAKLRRIWGPAAYTARMARIEQAVLATTGQILTYDGAPIDAAFFSTSNGYTENADEYWTTAVPYLRSVRSPWDRDVSPKYVHTVHLTSRAFTRALDLRPSALGKATGRLGAPIAYTTGRRVRSLTLDHRTLAGRTIRERLRLASSAFTITRSASGQITITTHGYGHGIGMSQYGAEGMARKGYSAEAILTYYYRGVQVEKN